MNGQGKPRALRIVIGERTDHGGAPHLNRDAPGQVEVLGGHLVVMASGVGGRVPGRVEGGLAVSAFLTAYRSASQREPVDRLLHALRHADDVLASRAHRSRGLAGTGARCTAVLVQNGMLYAVAAGDIGLYVVRGRHAVRVFAPAEPAPAGPHVTAQQLGVLGAGDALVAQASVEPYPLEPGDRVVLLGPGFTDALTEQEIAHATGDVAAPQAAAKLVERARAAGAMGVLTARVIQYGEGTSSGTLAPPPVQTITRAVETTHGPAPATPEDASPVHAAAPVPDGDGEDAVGTWFADAQTSQVAQAPARRTSANRATRHGLGRVAQPPPTTRSRSARRRAGVGVAGVVAALVAGLVVWRMTSPPRVPVSRPTPAAAVVQDPPRQQAPAPPASALAEPKPAPVAAIVPAREPSSLTGAGATEASHRDAAPPAMRAAHARSPLEALLDANTPASTRSLASALRAAAAQDDAAIERVKAWGRALRLAAYMASQHDSAAPMPTAVRKALDAAFDGPPERAAARLNTFIKTQYERSGDDVFAWIEQWVAEHPDPRTLRVLLRLASAPVGPRTRRWLHDRLPEVLAAL